MPITHCRDPTGHPSASLQRERGQQVPQNGYGWHYGPEEQKSGEIVERVKDMEDRLWPYFQRAPSPFLLRGDTGCSASQTSWARSSVLSLSSPSGFPGVLVWCVTSTFSGGALSAIVVVGNARKVTAPKGDGDSVTAEDASISSGDGGSHNGVLWVRTEDGARQSHGQRRALDDDNGVLSLPDTGLIAAAGQRDWASMAGTGRSRTCQGAGGAAGREGREEAEHSDMWGVKCLHQDMIQKEWPGPTRLLHLS